MLNTLAPGGAAKKCTRACSKECAGESAVLQRCHSPRYALGGSRRVPCRSAARLARDRSVVGGAINRDPADRFCEGSRAPPRRRRRWRQLNRKSRQHSPGFSKRMPAHDAVNPSIRPSARLRRPTNSCPRVPAVPGSALVPAPRYRKRPSRWTVVSSPTRELLDSFLANLFLRAQARARKPRGTAGCTVRRSTSHHATGSS